MMLKMPFCIKRGITLKKLSSIRLVQMIRAEFKKGYGSIELENL